MDNNKRTVAIVFDDENSGRKNLLGGSIENGNFRVFPSRETISEIRRELAPKKPDIVFITAEIYNREKFDDLLGFTRKARKYLKQSTLVLHTPPLTETQRKDIFQYVDGWVSDIVDYFHLADILEKITREDAKDFISSQYIIQRRAG